MKFRYRGVTRNWEEVQGSVEANDEAEARLRLQAMKVRPLSLREIGDRPASLPLSEFFAPRVELKSLIVFTRQLSSLIDSGVALVSALGVLAEQEPNRSFRQALFIIKESIEGGAGFAESLGRYPMIFSDFYVRVVEAGEISGTLDKSLTRVSGQLDKLNQIKRKVIRAATYPVMTLVISFFVVLFLLWKVVPEITKLYGTAKLPALTQVVITASQWLEQNILFLLGGALLALAAAISLYRVPSIRRKLDPIFLRLPIVGSLILRSAIATFSRTLSTLTASGVPLLTAFDICEKVVANAALKLSIRDAAQAVTEGRSITEGLGKRGYFPPMMLHMVSIGEMTGKLEELLEKVAVIYDEEVDDSVQLMTTLLQPALIVMVGAVIATILVAMYLPIFGMSEKLSGQ